MAAYSEALALDDQNAMLHRCLQPRPYSRGPVENPYCGCNLTQQVVAYSCSLY